MAGAQTLPVDLILDQSREATDRIADLLSQTSARQLRRIAGDLGEVQDVIMLMQMEKGPAPADDAVTMLLQIRRDLETLLVA
jgi:hypothetical protein